MSLKSDHLELGFSICCKWTIKSKVNGRHISVITYSDPDWRSNDVIYVLLREEKDRGMQYVGQTCRFLKKLDFPSNIVN